MIGLKRGEALLCAHCAEWEAEAERLVAQLKHIFGDSAADIQHIGSTSVKTIRAKPIIDIAIGIRSFDSLDRFLAPLLSARIYRSAGQPFADIVLFSLDDARTGFRISNIQVMIYDGEPWRRHILFRDYLNAHPEQAAAYEKLKDEAAVLYPSDPARYSAHKSKLIGEYIQAAMKESTARPQ